MKHLPTVTQTSAGGVVFRQIGQQVEIVLIQSGYQQRWQLPKGAVDLDESIEETALREVREETGVCAEIVSFLERIEYWYYAARKQKSTRYHKFVTFYLMKYLSGVLTDHDHEVTEARWVDIGTAVDMLSFRTEKDVMTKARQSLSSQIDPDPTSPENERLA